MVDDNSYVIIRDSFIRNGSVENFLEEMKRKDKGNESICTCSKYGDTRFYYSYGSGSNCHYRNT